MTAKVASPEKPQSHTLQCLFCQQLNPADVDYCKSCDEQLNLRPCYRCGAVDLRTATTCHKCGGDFSLAVPAVRDFQFRPSNFDQEPLEAGPGAPKSEAERQSADPTYSRLERKSVDAIGLPEDSPPAANPQRRTRVAVLALLSLLVMAALSAYLYRGRLARVDRPQGQEQTVSDLSDTRSTKEAAASRRTGLDSASTAADTGPSPPASENQAAARQSAAAPRADAALALPLPATSGGADTPQDPSTDKPCPPAVAALGLCNLDMPQEKR